MEQKLTQPELEELSAFIDGELEEHAAAKVRKLIDSDSAWAISYARLQALDTALDAFTAPAAPADLSARISAGVRRRKLWTRLLKWATPPAAAAAIALAVLLNLHPGGNPADNRIAVSPPPTPKVEEPSKAIDKALEGLDESDRIAVENMNFFKDYEVLDNFDTLQAMDRLEKGEG